MLNTYLSVLFGWIAVFLEKGNNFSASFALDIVSKIFRGGF